MSAVSSYNVGLGLNFSGQGDEQGIDAEMNGYPQEQYYASYAQGMQLKFDLLIWQNIIRQLHLHPHLMDNFLFLDFLVPKGIQ
jgi:hypothetical protein